MLRLGALPVADKRVSFQHFIEKKWKEKKNKKPAGNWKPREFILFFKFFYSI